MLIATDLDGTLVPEGTASVPPFTAGVLKRVDAAGIPVVFITARPLRWMDGFWPHVGRHGLAVVSNGAIVFDVESRSIRGLHGIPPDEGLGICEAIARALPGATFAIECADGIRLDPLFAEGGPAPGAPRGPLNELWTDPAVKLLVRHPDVPPDELHGLVSIAVGERATATWTTPGLVEISAAGVTKASALGMLCDRLGVPAAEVVAFGDMPNDIPMLTWAGTSYAMADAHESVRAVADHGAPPCEEEGVAQVLERLLDDASERC